MPQKALKMVLNFSYNVNPAAMPSYVSFNVRILLILFALPKTGI